MGLRIHRLWLLVMALLLPLLIGPPTHAQPLESSLGTYPLPPIVGMSGESRLQPVLTDFKHLWMADDDGPISLWGYLVIKDYFPGGDSLSVVVTIDHHATYGTRGIQFFELKTQTGSVAISADVDTAFAKVLTASAGKKIRITVEPYAAQEISR